MFGRILDRIALGPDQTPAFHAYLQRHIHLDGDFRGPLSLRLLGDLCAGDPTRIDEAETAAEEALCARIRLWDGVLVAIKAARGTAGAT
jgi:phage FluMu protein gp41